MISRFLIFFIAMASFAFSQTVQIEYLIVAGGGGGASGGGGAGGVLQATNYSIPMNSNISVIVGAGGSFGSGGAGSSGANIGGNGENSSISSTNGTITAIGGGGGGNSAVNAGKGANGGSGGGGSYDRPSVSYSSGEQGQGNRGGRSDRGGYGAGGGGGGGGENGFNAPTTHLGGPGGDGIQSSISGTANYYGGGGGGGVNHNCSCSVNNGGGQGGQGGGGNGSSLGYGNGSYNDGTPGSPNTGGGGGGTDPESTTANEGGSGIVIIRYLGGPNATGGAISQTDSYTIHTFTNIGNTPFQYNGYPEISKTKIALDNSTVSVTFSDAVYGGTANVTSTLEVSDFVLSMSSGSASLFSATPTSINVIGTTISLGISLSGTPDGSEVLTVLPVSNTIFSASGDTVSTTQTNNTTELVPNIVTDDVVLYLDASNTSSYPDTGTVWYDLSGNENNGTLNGAIYSSNGGGSISFDGSNDDVTIQDDNTLDITNDITISYSLEPNWGTWSPFIAKGTSNNWNYSTWVGNDKGIDIDHSSSGSVIKPLYTATSEMANGKISVITISRNSISGLIKTYVDGVLKNTRSGSLGSSNNTDLKIGTHNNGNYGHGKIGHLLIYNSTLTDQQVYQNYDALIEIPPTDISLTSNTISENSSISSLIGTLSATDSDTTINNLTFSLADSGDSQDDDNGSFTISGTSLLTSTTLDYETKTSYNIYVNVTDGTTDYAKAFTVSVINVLEPITDLGFEGIVKDGLLLHLDSRNSSSYPGTGSIWYDLSGNGFNGNLINSPSFSDENGGIITLDGSTQWVELNSFVGALTNTSSYTILLYFRSIETSPSGNIYNNAIFSMHKDYANRYRIGAAPDSSKGLYHNFGCSGCPDTRAGSGINLHNDEWRTAVISRDTNSNAKFYIDNNLVSAASISGSPSPFNDVNQVSIGQEFDGSTRSDHFEGSIPVVMVYNKALTAGEVSQIYYSINNNTSTSTISVDEEVAIGTLAGTLTATDSDTTDFTFSLVSGNGTNDQHNTSFTVSGTQLLVASNIDYETTLSLNIYVQASDGNSTFSKALTVNVNDVNEPPVITSTAIVVDNSVASVTFSELVYGGTAQSTSTLQASDFSLFLNGGTATLSSSTPSSISISGTTIGLGIPLSGSADGNELLTISPVADSVFDSQAGTAFTTQISNTVNLNPPNSAPSDISLSSTSVNENIAIRTTVGTLSSTDSDTLDTHIYSLVSGDGDTDNTSFSVSGTTLFTSTSLDYETKSIYSIRVQTSDGTATYAKTFTITVSDVFEDADGDGISDQTDNCQSSANPNQADNDNDGIGDPCDPDDDNDGILDSSDNCQFVANPNQEDSDLDGIGTACDSDNDNDGISDLDEIILGTNPFSRDSDGDGYDDGADAFASDPLEWIDTDADGVGNNADPDDDNDGYLDNEDDLPLNAQEWLDTDGDTIGNNADSDDDNDGFLDQDDAFPLDSFEWLDTDKDGIGNNSDTDDDGDDYYDDDEIECESDPLSRWSRPDDFDRDLIPDCIDEDDDNDGCLDQDDLYPLNSYECLDTDGDGFGDNADWDADNDGVHDNIDAFPRDPNESKDTDGDGIGDNADPDINNDGYPDYNAIVSTVLTPRSNGIESTWRIINIEMYTYSMVKVFSPDGSIVFKDINYKNDWNGTHYKTGKALPTGPYLYQIYVGEKEEPLTGWIYIFN